MTTRTWPGLVYIGTSVDGMIARRDGSLDWLTSRGEAAGDAGYAEFNARVDTMLIGRATTISRVPVLIGDGVPLFGPLDADIDLVHESTEVLGGGMVQSRYRVMKS